MTENHAFCVPFGCYEGLLVTLEGSPPYFEGAGRQERCCRKVRWRRVPYAATGEVES